MTETKVYRVSYDADAIRKDWKDGLRISEIMERNNVSRHIITRICGKRFKRHNYNDREVLHSIAYLMLHKKSDKEIIQILRGEDIPLTCYTLKRYIAKIMDDNIIAEVEQEEEQELEKEEEEQELEDDVEAYEYTDLDELDDGPEGTDSDYEDAEEYDE